MRRVRNVRHMAAGEKRIADLVFKSTIPYDRVLISDALGRDDREFTLPTNLPATVLYNVNSDDGDYVIHAGDGYYGMSTLKEDQATLIHELTHVWQGIHEGGYVFDAMMAQMRDDTYSYDPDRLKDWDQYNPEQQAKIVEDWFRDGRKEYDPATKQGDLRFYYIKAIIRGENVSSKWIDWPPSIKPMPEGKIDPEFLKKSRADSADGQLLPLLRQRFAANDVAGYGARARKVEDVFNSFDPFDAHDMRDRIQARSPGDEVVRLLYEHLSTAERNKLMGILNRISPY